jgi:DNA mismatch repair protein MutS
LALQGNPAADLGASDLEVQPAQILLVTGPNMAGKSTLMRQAALAVLLAQAGGFVPADDAVLGVHDAVLTRIGAADDIAEGASTFMVEMRETAWLLEHATPRTLVLLDEIGRGTSTYDGLSIAWAVIEALHDQARCLCLFATHYHELTALSEKLPRLRNAHVAVREWGQDIVFVHRLAPGPTNRSHGIAVARLAGLPAEVIERARRILAQLEKSAQAVQQQEEAVGRPRAVRQLSFFDVPPTEPAHAAPVDPGLLALARDLCRLDPDDLTPRQALAMVAELAARARELPNDVRRAADDAP